MEFWTGSHTKHRLMFHLVWIPKYRKRILKGRLTIRLEELFAQCAEVNRWKICEISIQVDHVHMLVQIPTTVSVARVVQLFKGGSSRILREEFPELEEFLWGDSFWSDGYFAETVGRVDAKVIEQYIRNQDR